MAIVLVIFIILWFAGYGPFGALKVPLFHFLGRGINLWDILIFLLVIYLIDTLPGPIREVVVFFLIFWILSLVGIITFVGFNHILFLALVIGLLIYAVKK